MRQQAVLALAGALFILASLGHAQSLGDVARQTRSEQCDTREVEYFHCQPPTKKCEKQQAERNWLVPIASRYWTACKHSLQ